MRNSVLSHGIKLALLTLAGTAWAQQPAHHWAIVLHGGAGVIERSKLGPEGDSKYRAGLQRAIEAGAKGLDQGGSSMDAVEAAIHVLEDDPAQIMANYAAREPDAGEQR